MATPSGIWAEKRTDLSEDLFFGVFIGFLSPLPNSWLGACPPLPPHFRKSCVHHCRTRNDTVELIVEKELLLLVVFCVLEGTFYSLIQSQDKNRFICANEAAIGKSLVIANSDN